MQRPVTDIDGALQHFVTDGMAIGVVDVLEMVEVEQDQAGATIRTCAIGKHAIGLLDEMLAIADAGEAIAASELHEAQLRTAQPQHQPYDRGEACREDDDVEPAGFDFLAIERTTEAKDLVLLVERIDFRFPRDQLLVDDLEGDAAGAQIVQIRLVRCHELLVVTERGRRIADALLYLVEHAVTGAAWIGEFVANRTRNGREAKATSVRE